MTYSFPCQDLSLAGKGAGMERGSGTRSGLLWEVERILSECKEKPQILLMENVTQVHGAGNDVHFKEWQLRLEEMGYQSYWNDMSAVDYGIPQTRNRTFMVSILGDYNYKFPKKTPLKLRLKNLLEPNSTVDEKYYLSQKMISFFTYNEMKQKEKGNGFKFNVSDGNDIAKTITTRSGSRMDDNFIGNKCLTETLLNNDLSKIEDVAYADCYNRNVKTDGTSNTITIRINNDTNFLLIKNATQKGYLEATEGDGIDISSRMESHRGTVQKDKTQTITTMGGENVGIVVGTYDYAQSDTLRPSEESRLHLGKETSGALLSSGNQNGVVIQLKRGYSCEVKNEKDETKDIDYIGNYSKSNFNQTSIVGKNGIAPTVTENHGQVTAIVEKEESLKKELCNKLINDGMVEEGDIIKHSYTQQILDGNKKCVEKNDGCMITLTTRGDTIGVAVKEEINPNYEVGLRIRKLTPKECFRLMGVKDEDIKLVMQHQTNASSWHLAGDSIVTTCLMAIFSQLLGINYKDYFNNKEWWNNEKIN